MDRLEDLDDDDDGVLNANDRCPQSRMSAGPVDEDGCTASQREKAGSSEGISQYKGKLHDIMLEIFVGALVNALAGLAWTYKSDIGRAWCSLRTLLDQKFKSLGGPMGPRTS